MEKTIPMIFYITTPDKKTAMKLANGIVSEKIAACANIIEKITSIYWWDGKLNTDLECMMILKTIKEHSQELIKYIQQHHPYEVPECIGINITEGSEPYLQWIADSTSEE
jgi:periplasmic divalent cation tolerance protein